MRDHCVVRTSVEIGQGNLFLLSSPPGSLRLCTKFKLGYFWVVAKDNLACTLSCPRGYHTSGKEDQRPSIQRCQPPKTMIGTRMGGMDGERERREISPDFRLEKCRGETRGDHFKTHLSQCCCRQTEQFEHVHCFSLTWNGDGHPMIYCPRSCKNRPFGLLLLLLWLPLSFW